MSILSAFKFKTETPHLDFEVFLKRHAERRRFTPDMHILERKEFQLLFVPDEFKQAGHKFDLVNEGSVRICTAYTKEDYQFIQKRIELEKPMGIIFEDLRTASEKRLPITEMAEYLRTYPYGKIRGELYATRPYQFNKLDIERQNGVEFFRKRVHLVIPYQEKYVQLDRDTGGHVVNLTGQQVYILRAWMYHGVRSFWEPQLDAGFEFSKVKQFKSGKQWIKNPYYEFQCPK